MWDEFNPEMLTLARRARGRSQSDLAKAFGLSSGLLSKWENGVAVPPMERIHELAAELHYPARLFFQPERVRGTDSVCFYHRKRKTMPMRLLDQVEAEMHLAQVQTSRLLRDLEIEWSLPFLTIDPDEHDGPAGVARVLRAYWHIPRGPVPNLIRLVEAAGAVVILRDFGSRKLDGMSCWAKSTPPLFFLNDSPVDRMRWTLAHELGHLIMHGSPTDGDPEEEADRFAQELLLPEDEVKSDLRRLTFGRLPSLKAHWRVSMKALITAASKLGLLPANRIKSLYVQYSRAGWNQGEPYPLPPEEPTVIRDAVQVHLDEHGYSVSELAAVVHLEPDEFRERYGVSPGEDQQRLRIV